MYTFFLHPLYISLNQFYFYWKKLFATIHRIIRATKVVYGPANTQTGFSVWVAFCVWKQAAHTQCRRCILWATLPPMVVNLKEPTILSWATNTAKWPKTLRMRFMADAQSGTNYKFFQLLKTSVECLLRIKVGPFSSLAQCWHNSATRTHGRSYLRCAQDQWGVHAHRTSASSPWLHGASVAGNKMQKHSSSHTRC